MTESNPTVGLAAHIGQTDVRITTKTDTEAEADQNIARMEAVLRERLGVAIYGEGKETVASVLGDLLTEKGLKLGVIDTLTDGQLTREMTECGHSERIVEIQPGESAGSGEQVAEAMARQAAAETGLGLAMVGPFDDETTYMAVHGPDDSRLIERSRNFQNSDHIRRWLTTQGLDWVRRVLLGQLTSPADFR
jgi:nicotinamide mononucleotide (NMN) deamidase PncC